MAKKTIVDLFEQSVSRYPDNVYLLENSAAKKGLEGDFEPTSYSQVREQVYSLAAGMILHGVRQSDHVALLSEGRNMWVISELAIFYAGAVNVPLSVKLEQSNDLLHRLAHAEVTTIVTSARELRKIRAIRSQLPLLERIVVIDDIPLTEGELSASQLMAEGARYLSDPVCMADFLKVGQSLQNDDVATIIYTSGTTSDPKGVMLTHRNYTANVEQSLSCIDFKTEWTVLILLPLDHCFAHVVAMYSFMAKGATIATVPQFRSQTEGIRNISMSMRKVRPHLILSVPAIAKNFRRKIEAQMESESRFKRAVYKFALGRLIIYDRAEDSVEHRTPVLYRPVVNAFRRYVSRCVYPQFGGRLLFFISGGAMLDLDLQRYFFALGIPMYQGYGLSETTPVISTNSSSHFRLGSCGTLAEKLQMRICDDYGRDLPVGSTGEIVVKGENVMKGYWKNSKATDAVLRDGWLHTGDLGHLDSDGYLYVQGRSKNILISADGEKYSPEGIEEAIECSNCIFRHVILQNNQFPYTVAVLDLDKALLPEGVEGLELVKTALDRFRLGGDLSGSFPERWLPGTFIVADEPFSEANGMINPTGKVVRKKVLEIFADRIESACTPEGKAHVNNLNIKALNDIK